MWECGVINHVLNASVSLFRSPIEACGSTGKVWLVYVGLLSAQLFINSFIFLADRFWVARAASFVNVQYTTGGTTIWCWMQSGGQTDTRHCLALIPHQMWTSSRFKNCIYSGQTAGKMQLTSKVSEISFLTLPLNRSLPVKNYTSSGPGNQMLLQNLMVDICFDFFADGGKTTNFCRNSNHAGLKWKQWWHLSPPIQIALTVPVPILFSLKSSYALLFSSWYRYQFNVYLALTDKKFRLKYVSVLYIRRP
jgi:hypothetical protein